MKQKNTYLIFLLSFISLLSLASLTSFAQLAVTATGTSGTCSNDAKITAVATGNTGAVSYQLLQGSTVIRAYQSNNVFENLPAGTYSVKIEDIATANTANSSNVVLTTSYAVMSIAVTSSNVACASLTTGSLTVDKTGGKAPYTYRIMPDPNSAGAQSSNIFNNLPVGSYTVSVTDACGATVTQGSSISAASTTVDQIQPPYGGAFITWGNFQNAEFNDCSKGAFANTYGWTYKSTNSYLNAFDTNNFYWRYEYPSGSGNVYGAGGVLNGAMVPLSTQSIQMPATAVYPFADGDIIIYDACGNFYRNINALWQSTATSALQQGTGNLASPFFDCVNGGGVTMQFTTYQTICAPVTYTFVDDSNASTVTQILTDDIAKTVYGFVPGHTYTVTAVDALGHNATNTTSITIPTTVGNVELSYFEKSAEHANANIVSVDYPVVIPAGQSVSYEVTASNNAGIPVGYSQTFTYPIDASINSELFGNPTFGSNVWPEGTYTLKFNSGTCIVDSYLTFTVSAGFVGSFNGVNNVNANCGAFNADLQATLDDPNGYQVKIISGPSNVNAIRGFNATAVGAGVYKSFSFDGLSYGTYTFGLLVKGGSTPISTQTVAYTASNELAINALVTGGYVCSNETFGNLVVTASSASGSALQYSNDDGASWQNSSIFSNVPVGNYSVKVKDACGNIVSYSASIVEASDIVASVSSASPCVGSSVQLSVNAIGATSYSWVGPNGFTSTLQNPAISNITAAYSGTYTVTVTSPTCSNVANINISVKALPVATVVYAGTPLCASGTAMPTITGTTGGAFSAGAGLSLNTSTGAIDLNTSLAGVYTVTYAFSDGSCTNTTTANVEIKALPLLVTNSQWACATATVDLTAAGVTAGSASGLTFSYFADALAAVPLSNPAAIAASGTYYIQGYLESTGCYSKITSVAVTIRPKPNLVINNPVAVCSGTAVDLTALAITSGSDASLSYAYYSNAAGTAILTNPAAVTVGGTYYVQATSTITSCVSDIKPVLVVVNVVAKPTIAVTGLTSLCPGATASLKSSAATGNQWYKDGILIPAATNQIYTATATGSYTVNVKEASGCSATSDAVVITNTALTTTTLSSAVGTTIQNICINTAIANITYNVAGATTTAIVGLPAGLKGVLNAGVFTISGTATVTGVFNYTLTASGLCNTVSNTGTLTINAVPVVSISSAGVTSISKGDEITLTASGSNAVTWSPSTDIVSGQGTTTLKVRPKQTTTYTVTATNTSGCISTANITIEVVDDFKLIPSNVITPNGDGKNDTWIVKNIDYYPNNKVYITDRAGRKVFTAVGYQNNWDGTYNGMPLAEGAYFYIIDLGKEYGTFRGTISIIRDLK